MLCIHRTDRKWVAHWFEIRPRFWINYYLYLSNGMPNALSPHSSIANVNFEKYLCSENSRDVFVCQRKMEKENAIQLHPSETYVSTMMTTSTFLPNADTRQCLPVFLTCRVGVRCRTTSWDYRFLALHCDYPVSSIENKYYYYWVHTTRQYRR